MNEALMTWSWVFLIVYIIVMLGIGYFGHKRVRHADDYAVARGSYGPIFLAFAFAATTASGATFLGGPGLAYQIGLASMWGNFLYPMGVYFGVLISMRLIATSGHKFGNRSIPEFLGDRYQSEGIRILVSILSLVLFFYIAGQLVSGLVMFETMLGLDTFWALTITTVVLLIYVVLGGAHADILTDGVQGIMMLALAIIVILLFLFAVGFDGGVPAVVENLRLQDEHLAKPLNVTHPLTHSPWSVIAVFFAHIPLGLLPHLGNKLWALKSTHKQGQFVKLAFVCGLTLGMMALGGLLARGLLGDELLSGALTPNASLPLLFIEVVPTWLAALIGVGILAAIMSTADGLVVSSSQVIANDLYRRTFVPKMKLDEKYSEEQIDKHVLTLSRLSTVVVLVLCAVYGVVSTKYQYCVDRVHWYRRNDGCICRAVGDGGSVARCDAKGCICWTHCRIFDLRGTPRAAIESGLVRLWMAVLDHPLALQRRTKPILLCCTWRICLRSSHFCSFQIYATALRGACQCGI